MHDTALQASRVLMGDSLGFHIIFVLFGLSFPIFVSGFEWFGIWRRDQRLTNVAVFWSKIMALLVITGVLSGTIIALQMSLVWPGILKFGGKVIGLPFMFETYAFLIEAVFLSLYMATWHSTRVPAKLHAVFGLFVVLGSTLSAYTITSVNGWMNLPSGFEYVNGALQHISVWQAMFSRVALIEFAHSMPGYYLAAALSIASVYVVKQLRRRDITSFDWYIIRTMVIFATCMFVFSAITADLTGKYLAKYEAVKLAAIELNYTTRSNAPLLIGGVGSNEGEVRGPHFEIPGALSLLAGNSTSTAVKGLNETPLAERPPLYVHTFFDIKMTIITFLAPFLLLCSFAAFKRPKWLQTKIIMLGLGLTGIAGICLVELGWMMTEIGRQPWAVRGYVTTAQALTSTHDVTSFGYIFPLSYVALFAVTIIGIKKIVNDERKGQAN